MHTESLTRIFFDLFLLIYIWISYGFASVTACGCRGWTYFFCPFGQLYLSIVSIGDSEDTLDDIGGVEIYEQSNFLASNP